MIAKQRLLVAIGFLLACVLSASPCALAAGVATAKELASHSWAVTASPNLARHPPSIHVITEFVKAIELTHSSESNFDDIEHVCSYKFADFRGNGDLSLVVVSDISGRDMCNSAYIINKASSSFEVYYAGVYGNSAADSIVDPRNDGKLVYREARGLASMAPGCTAEWTSYYAWTGKDYTEVGEQFQDLYKERLSELDKQIASHKGAEQGTEPFCLEAEAAAIQRYLGISPEAGIEEAIELSKSDNWIYREFAASLFREIGTQRTRPYLESLARDRNRAVSATAKMALARPHQSPPPIGAPESLKSFEVQSPLNFQ